MADTGSQTPSQEANAAALANFRRIKSRLGTPAAITAIAHKLAGILFHLIKARQSFDESVFAQIEERTRYKQLSRLQKNAASFGYQLIPAAGVP